MTSVHRRRLRTHGPRAAAPALSRTTTDTALARLEGLVRDLGARRAALAWCEDLDPREARAMAAAYALVVAQRMEAKLLEAAASSGVTGVVGQATKGLRGG